MKQCGGPDQDRTGDTSLFRRVLYQLSYRATNIRCAKELTGKR